MRCIFSISEEALEIRWRSLVRCKTNRCQQTRRHDEGHQQGSRTVESYTNHSVRATAITLWSNAGVQNRHIMAISGHRSEQSLAHYNTRPSTSQLQQCSDVLSRSLNAENSFFSGNQINDHTQIQEHSVMTTGTSSSFLGSLFNNCTVQQAHVHVTLGSDFSQGRWLEFSIFALI